MATNLDPNAVIDKSIEKIKLTQDLQNEINSSVHSELVAIDTPTIDLQYNQLTLNPQAGDLVYKDQNGDYKFIIKDTFFEYSFILKKWEFIGYVELPKDEEDKVQVYCPEKIEKTPRLDYHLIHTGKMFDLALDHQGSSLFPFFFQVFDQSIDEYLYTQQGYFILGDDGNLHLHPSPEVDLILEPELGLVPEDVEKIRTGEYRVEVSLDGHIGVYETSSGDEMVGAEIPVFIIINTRSLQEVYPFIYRQVYELTPYNELPYEEKLRWANMIVYIETGELVESGGFNYRRDNMNKTSSAYEMIPGQDNAPLIKQGFLNKPIDFRIYTSYQFDLRLNGYGYFQIEMDGILAYTRNSRYCLNVDGTLVDPNGFILQPEFAVPPESANLQLNSLGRISAADVSELEIASAPIALYWLSTPDAYAKGIMPDQMKPIQVPTESIEYPYNKITIGGIDYFLDANGLEEHEFGVDNRPYWSGDFTRPAYAKFAEIICGEFVAREEQRITIQL